MDQFIENNRHIPANAWNFMMHHDFSCALDTVSCPSGHATWAFCWIFVVGTAFLLSLTSL